jgi:hypothetical protein
MSSPSTDSTQLKRMDGDSSQLKRMGIRRSPANGPGEEREQYPHLVLLLEVPQDFKESFLLRGVS